MSESSRKEKVSEQDGWVSSLSWSLSLSVVEKTIHTGQHGRAGLTRYLDIFRVIKIGFLTVSISYGKGEN